MRLLLVEDEPRLAAALRRGLEEEGYVVDHAPDAVQADEMAAGHYDAFIVDWRLPRGDGRQFVASLRAAGRTEPVLMLTALSDVEHRVAGLDAGADDYLAKPFAFEELLARLRALLRRTAFATPDPGATVAGATVTGATVTGVMVDAERRRVTLSGPRGETALTLRPKEYDLLRLLLGRPEAVLSRTVIAERVWGEALFVSDNTLDQVVSSLRRQLAEARGATGADGPEIETVRGVGYRLVARV